MQTRVSCSRKWSDGVKPDTNNGAGVISSVRLLVVISSRR